MIHFFTGKPGNGKSLHMAEIIYREMKKGKNVIANFPVNEGYFENCRHPEKTGVFLYEPNFYWLNNAYILPGGTSKSCSYSYIDGLYNYARMFHKRNKKGQIIEKQTLLVLDECQELFNNRLWNRKDRLLWTGFFRQHRKLGYEVYLISQDDKVIDKQIRNVLQFEYEHLPPPALPGDAGGAALPGGFHPCRGKPLCRDTEKLFREGEGRKNKIQFLQREKEIL